MLFATLHVLVRFPLVYPISGIKRNVNMMTSVSSYDLRVLMIPELLITAASYVTKHSKQFHVSSKITKTFTYNERWSVTVNVNVNLMI